MVFGHKQTKEAMNKYKKQINNSTELDFLKVQDGVKAQYNMFGAIYQEIAILRLEVSRVGTLVRINNANSPELLTPYHAHILSLLIPCSTIVPNNIWDKIVERYDEVGKLIIDFLKRRKNVTNLKIPANLIKELDSLYRIALLLGQRAGIGISTEQDTDINKAIEKAVIGST